MTPVFHISHFRNFIILYPQPAQIFLTMISLESLYSRVSAVSFETVADRKFPAFNALSSVMFFSEFLEIF